jgi:2,3-bisphosphoglycerate-independent phosphoglycerate mutase
MARLYTDEHFPRESVLALRALGHDVLTVQEAGKANQGIPDEEVLAFAASIQRAVVTLNRYDFIKLHTKQTDHAGIVVCTENQDFAMLATRIDEAISYAEALTGQLIRVYK